MIMRKAAEMIKKKRTVILTVLYAVAALIAALVTGVVQAKAGTEYDSVYYNGDCDMLADYSDTGYVAEDIRYDKGIYALVLAYETNGFATVRLTDASGVVSADELLLTPYSNYTESYIYVKSGGGHAGLDISAAYKDMSLRIYSVSVRRLNGLSGCYAAVRLIVLMVILYLAFMLIRYFTSNAAKEKKLTVAGLLTILVVSLIGFLPGLMSGHISGGHDVEAHMGRIAAIAAGIKGRVLPVRMYGFFANDQGYPMGIFYGDILLYPSALLHMLGVPLWKCYLIYAALIGVLTVVISYVSFVLISGRRDMSLLATGMYVLSLWRLNDVYIRAAAGEYSAMAFIPLIAVGLAYAAGFGAYAKDEKKSEQTIFYCLTFGVSGVLHTHMLTCVMIFVFGTLFCLIYIKRVVRGDKLPVIIKSAATAVLLNLSFIIPFADMYVRNDMVVKHLSNRIQGHGVYPVQLLTMGGDYAEISHGISEGLSMSEEMPFSIGIGSIVIFLLLVYVSAAGLTKGKVWLKTNGNAGYVLAGLILLSLWLSTCYFPYDSLADRAAFIAGILGGVQFPWRYLVIVTLLTCMACIYVCKNMDYVWLKVMLGVITVLSALIFMYKQNTADNKYADQVNVYQIKSMLMDSDIMYLPQDMDTEILKDRRVICEEEDVAVQDMGFDGVSYTIGVVNDTEEDGHVTIPLIYYGGYHTYSQGSDEGAPVKDAYTIEKGEDSRLRLIIPPGTKDIIEIRFTEPWYYRLAEVISAIVLMALIISICIVRRKKNEK